MKASLFARRGTLAAVAASAVALLCLVGLSPASASADVTTGKAIITINSGKAGHISAVKPATVSKRIGRKGAKVTGSVSEGMFGNGASAAIAGGIRFTNGKRKITATALRVDVTGKKTTVTGKLAGKSVSIFNALRSDHTFSCHVELNCTFFT